MSNRTTPTQQLQVARTFRGRPGTLLRIVACAALILLTLVAGGGTAHAHASLLESTPATGALLETAPSVLELVFNEDVDVLETTRLSRADETVPYQVDVEGGLVAITPETILGDGLWQLAWQVVSADGHLVGGVISFTVGEGAAIPAETGSTHGVEHTGGAGSSGASSGGGGTLDRVLELLGWVALVVALGAHVAGRAAIGRTAAVAALTFPLLRLIDAHDRFGSDAIRIGETRATIAALGAAVLLLLAWAAKGLLLRNVLLVGGISAWSAQAVLSGHPNVLDPRWLHTGVAAVHLGAALTWSAAVSAILLDQRVAVRASRIATWSVAALVPAAGVLAATFLVGYERGRWETLLGVKILLVLGALALGLQNHRSVRSGGTNLRRRTMFEIALIAAVAVLTATLTAHVPTRVAAAGARPAAPTPETAGVGDAVSPDATSAGATGSRPASSANATLEFENGEIGELLLEATSDGRTVIHLVLRDPSGAPFIAEQAGYELENRDAGIGGIAGDLPVSGGMHMGETALPVPGIWRITVHATYDTFTTITATAEIDNAGE